MTYTILFVVMLILVSGFIAYFGDILGRRMGKKRLTLFGLRPKYTAIVITTITGMIISTLALFTLITVNSQFRRVFTQGERIVHLNDSLTKSNTELERNIRTLSAEGIEMKAELARVQVEFKAAKAKADAARREAAIARAARDTAQKQVAQLRESIAASKISLGFIQLRNAAQVQRLARLNKILAEAKQRLADANERLVDAQGRALDIQKLVDANEKTMIEQQARIVTLGKQNLDFERQMRSQKVTFRQGDEIARAVISPRESSFIIRASLYSLLTKAGARAETQGASPGKNGRAVNLVYRQLDSGELRITNTDEKECLDAAQDLIGRSAYRGVPVLVQVLCASNSVEGEQVPVEMKFYTNGLVFSKGQRISIGVADGKGSEGRVLLWLTGFLQDPSHGVTASALNAGVVPIANPGALPQVGVNAAQQVDALIAVTEEIRNVQGQAKVEVYAANDIYAADSLNMNNMRFKIVPLKSE